MPAKSLPEGSGFDIDSCLEGLYTIIEWNPRASSLNQSVQKIRHDIHKEVISVKARW